MTIGQLAKTPGWSLERLLGPAAGEKLSALAWNRDPRAIGTQAAGAFGRRAVGARQEAGRSERVIRPTLLHLADRVATRLRAKVAARPDGDRARALRRHARGDPLGRRSTQPISATAMLAEIAEELVRPALADHPHEKTISLLAISVSHLEERDGLQLELPLGLADESRRPGSKRGLARFDGRPRHRQDPRPLRLGGGRLCVGGARASRSVPDAFRELAEKEL